MDNKTRVAKPNPAKGTNILSGMFMWYTKDIFVKCNRGEITLNDIYDPLPPDESERLGDRLEKLWNVELERARKLEYGLNSEGKKVKPMRSLPSLKRALFRMFVWQNAWLGLMLIFNNIFVVIQPLFLGWVIDFFRVSEDNIEEERHKALIYTTLMILTKLGSVGLLHHMFRQSLIMGMRMRVACCTLIYRKMLRLSKSVLDKAAAGQVINLMSNDVSRFDKFFQFLNYVWVTPFQVIFVAYLMWDVVGVTLFAGIAILLIIAIPLQSIVIYMSKILREKIAVLTDTRVQLMSELVSGIQVVKMYAWELPFQVIVDNTRLAEMKKIKITSYIRSIFTSSMVYTERTTLFSTLVLFVVSGNHLTADISFVVATYFNILQLSIIYMMPNGLIATGEASVSVKRIEEFLLLDEISSVKTESPKCITGLVLSEKDNNKIISRNEEPTAPVEIIFNRTSANWVSGQLPPTLYDLSFRIEAGSLCALAGIVGSGKSAILNLLLRELPVGAGSVILRQRRGNNSQENEETMQRQGYHSDNPNIRISYACQDAWLFAGSVRDNILFGLPYDAARYSEVTEVCALRRDFEQLANGDMTLVGERGSLLSGGQRARVNLARAVYRPADLYLLDDPLSAVDPRVARHLFNKCIRGYLAGTTRIVVTHQLQFLRHADSIVFLDRGSVKYHGSYNNVTNLNPKVMELLGKLKSPEEEAAAAKKKAAVEAGKDFDTVSISSDVSSLHSIETCESDPEVGVEQLAGAEEGSTWNNFDIFSKYFSTGASICGLGLYIFVVLLTQVVTSGTDYWLSFWTNLEEARDIAQNRSTENLIMSRIDPGRNYTEQPEMEPMLTTNQAIYVYTGLLVSCAILCTFRNSLTINICMRASERLHKIMFANLLHAKMNFFNKNPAGQILNRFSKDTGSMDELLPRFYTEAVQIFSIMFGVLLIIAYTNYFMIIPIIIILVLFWYAEKIFLKAALKIKRWETITKSPVFSHVNASLNGLATIRSCGPQVRGRLIKEFDSYQDEHSGAAYLSVVTGTTFSIYLDFILVIFNAVVAYTFVLVNDGKILSGNVGLALSQANMLTGMVQYGFHLFIDFIGQLTSVERILQYTDLPKEAPLTSSNPPPPDWPRRGRIILKNMSMRYEENEPFVLKDLNITIESGWKVGIVGRTGAGKSSIIAALFRLTGENLVGEIKIDGIDTANVGLQELRARISIIPQEPVLFTASLRYNLDPFGQYDDAALWAALREVELTELQLDQQVAEKGANFSVGQRQLICLARAIVRQNKVLVLDEATANIDTHTDAIIQETIRRRFAKCTVLTVAHRLNTIIDSDRIIVMDNGTIVEFGCPHELLTKKSDGHFLQMINQTGKAMAKKLVKQAEQSCLRNTQHRSLDIVEDSLDGQLILERPSEESYSVRL